MWEGKVASFAGWGSRAVRTTRCGWETAPTNARERTRDSLEIFR